MPGIGHEVTEYKAKSIVKKPDFSEIMASRADSIRSNHTFFRFKQNFEASWHGGCFCIRLSVKQREVGS